MQSVRLNPVTQVALAVLFCSTACLFFGARKPTITNHTMPEFPPAPGGFDESSCPETSGVRACPPQSELGGLGCSQIRPPGDVLSGLRPAYPLEVCRAGTPGGPKLPKDQYLYRDGCLAAYYIRYIIDKDGKFELIKSVSDLQKNFAPIENEVEALSYALASTGLGVRYDLQYEPGLRYFAKDIEDTNVQRNEKGYRVHLYDYQSCGCGPHSTTAVDLQVTFDGQVEEIQRAKMYEDPAEDKLCVD